MKKWVPLLSFLLVILLALVVLAAMKDFLIKTAIETASPNIVGAKVKMGSFSLGVFSRKVHITDFKLYNPPGFPDQVLVDMREVSMEADIPQLLKGRMHFPMVVFNMNNMVIVKNKEGKLNVDSLKIVQEQMAANKGKPMKLPAFKIDVLDLNLGKVVFEDYTHAPPVHIDAYDVGIKDQKIRDINGIPKLVTVVIVDALKPTAIRSAGLLAAEALLGVGFLPAVAISIVVAKDSVKADLDCSFGRTYQESLKLVKELGSVKKEDRKNGQILANVYGCDVTITVQDTGWNKSHVSIKARKYLMARLETANGLLYQLTQSLR
jgi:hypothetical protein